MAGPGARRAPVARSWFRWTVWVGATAAALSLAVAGVARAAAPNALPAPVEHGPTDVRAMAFACNVVWGTEYVMPIARAFAQAHARATFFLGGAWAAAHPAEARELRAMGMEIASHGYGHRHVASLGLSANLEEIDRATSAIREATGVTPRLYAPAYGEVNATVREAAAMRSMPVVLWSIDTIDWRTWHTPDVIRRRVLDRAAPGAIVLIHPTDRTLAALPELLASLSGQGYRLTTVSDLLQGAAKAAEPAPAAEGR
jgi:peptidoglycan-N-acetylglucosamine deacetylase